MTFPPRHPDMPRSYERAIWVLIPMPLRLILAPAVLAVALATDAVLALLTWGGQSPWHSAVILSCAFA